MPRSRSSSVEQEEKNLLRKIKEQEDNIVSRSKILEVTLKDVKELKRNITNKKNTLRSEISKVLSRTDKQEKNLEEIITNLEGQIRETDGKKKQVKDFKRKVKTTKAKSFGELSLDEAENLKTSIDTFMKDQLKIFPPEEKKQKISEDIYDMEASINFLQNLRSEARSQPVAVECSLEEEDDSMGLPILATVKTEQGEPSSG